jgi:hypothetical protein
VLKLVDVTIGLRVSETEEAIGLDLTQHGEEAYAFEAAAGFAAMKELAVDLPAPTVSGLGAMPTLSEAGD